MENRKGTSTKRPGDQSHTSDVAEDYITVTDIKHHLYCPRIVYFDRVMHSQPILAAQQQASRETHEKLEEKEKRRKAAVFYSSEFEKAEKSYRVPLQSERLGLRGTLDLLISTGSEYLPVEYKEMPSNKGRTWLDHKYQLTAYALLIDESFRTTVRRGIVNYINEDLIVPCEITDGMKRYTRRIIDEIRTTVSQQKLPPVTVPASKCHGGCGYLWICKRR